MKIAIAEPLVVDRNTLDSIIKNALGDSLNDVVIEHFTERTTDEAELVARSKDAEIVVIGNVAGHCLYWL